MFTIVSPLLSKAGYIPVRAFKRISWYLVLTGEDGHTAARGAQSTVWCQSKTSTMFLCLGPWDEALCLRCPIHNVCVHYDPHSTCQRLHLSEKKLQHKQKLCYKLHLYTNHIAINHRAIQFCINQI